MGTPPAASAFSETREATEALIALGLVRGERLKGGDGVYFTGLKLLPRGEQTAIQVRKQSEVHLEDLAETAEQVQKILDQE
jgi:hypothetical protein